MIAGGVEHMTRAPLVKDKGGSAFARGNRTAYDSTLGWRFVNPEMDRLHGTLGMGHTAENVAERCNVSREAQDAFALSSQQKAGAAMQSGRFDREIIPVQTGVQRKTKEPIVVSADEHPRPEITAEKLAKLRPVCSLRGQTSDQQPKSDQSEACHSRRLDRHVSIMVPARQPSHQYTSGPSTHIRLTYRGPGS